MSLPEYRNGSDWDNFSDKQQAFLSHYIKTWNATEAKEKAGYSKGTSGQGILEHPKIRRWLGKFKREMFDRNEIDVAKLLMKINNGIRRDPADLCDEEGVISSNLREIPLHMREQIDSIEQEVKELMNPESGEVVGRSIKTKIGLIKNADLMRMAIDISGLVERGREGEGVEIDWDSLVEKPQDEFDAIEQQISSVKTPTKKAKVKVKRIEKK